jgi:predicted metalloprotease
MDWTPGGLSDDIEDRRGSSGGGGGFGGGGGLGIVGFIVLVIISLVTGRNYIGSYLSGHAVPSQTSSQPTNGYGRGATTASPQGDRSAQLVSFVLDDVQRTWTILLPEQTHRNYRRAKLVLFNNYTRSGCGVAQSQTGPFYCPADEKVYIDLSFWNELRRLGGSNADFAQAYVIAHELGHHVQNILGIEQQVQHLSGENPGQKNKQYGAAPHRPRRGHRRRSAHCRRCRRRSHPEDGARCSKPGELHPRHLRTACRLV